MASIVKKRRYGGGSIFGHPPLWPWSSDDEDFSELHSDDAEIGCPAYVGFLLDKSWHEILDPVAKFCLKHYNDKHVMLNSEYHYTLKVKNSVNGLVETFQARTTTTGGLGLDAMGYREVLDCKISGN
ncbi:hypothetical protein ACFE04_020908 [Oxalis oulophora]